MGRARAGRLWASPGHSIQPRALRLLGFGPRRLSETCPRPSRCSLCQALLGSSYRGLGLPSVKKALPRPPLGIPAAREALSRAPGRPALHTELLRPSCRRLDSRPLRSLPGLIPPEPSPAAGLLAGAAWESPLGGRASWGEGSPAPHGLSVC